MMNNIIERKDKKQITKDWLSFFLEFREYKPMHILRRNGAFLCGIHLQTYSSNIDYEPIFHIYNLMVDFPVISLSSPSFLLNKEGAKDGVSLMRHKTDIESIVNLLKQQAPLLQNSTVFSNELVSYIKKSVHNSIDFPVDSLQDIVLALFWCGKIEEANMEIENGKKIISQWPNGAVQRFGGAEGWEKQIRKLMDINTLTSTIKMQLQKFKLTEYIDYQFSCSSDKVLY